MYDPYLTRPIKREILISMLNKKYLIKATLAAVFASAVVSAPRASAVINASPETPANTANRFPQVVEIRSAGEVCTGTIVGPRVIVSAAHCADLKNPVALHAGQRYAVRYTSSLEYPKREHDVAVALTNRDIVDAHFGSIGGGVHHGSVITLAGYGCTQRGGTSGALHTGATKVIGMDADHLLSYSDGGGVLCQGDSGGPAFLRADGRDVLVAVNSAGDNRNINLNVRLDSALSRNFLKRIAERFHVAICGITRTCPKTHIIAAY